jgi:hypothetical protein
MMVCPVPSSHHPGAVVLLGPQKNDGATLRAALDAVGVEGPVALISAGWQEAEGEDDDVRRWIGRPVLNLALHARSEDIYRQDPELARASHGRQQHLHLLQQFYQVRLEHMDDADRGLAVRHVSPELLDAELVASADHLRFADTHHLMRVLGVHRAWEEAWAPGERPVVQRHRAEVAELLGDARAVVVAGGHVMSLLNRVRLLDALAAVGDRPVLGWSAGAMLLTERVVIFHDRPPFGKNMAQVVDAGLGLVGGVVAMPDAAHRVDASLRRGVQRFARRMAPAWCLTLDADESVAFLPGATGPALHARRLTEAGSVAPAGGEGER